MSLLHLIYIFVRDLFIVGFIFFIVLLFLEAVEYGAVTFWIDVTKLWIALLCIGIVAFVLGNINSKA